jgi:hypothetical protein
MEEEAGRRMERGDDQLRGTTGSLRVAAVGASDGGGEIEIQMEAATVGGGASSSSSSSGHEGDAEEGLQQVRSLFKFFCISFLCRSVACIERFGVCICGDSLHALVG